LKVIFEPGHEEFSHFRGWVGGKFHAEEFDVGGGEQDFGPDAVAGCLAGDLEERFQRICQGEGRIRAAVWFWWELLVSLPSIVTAAMSPVQDTTPAGLSNRPLPFAA
jgi:hypothetical protein